MIKGKFRGKCNSPRCDTSEAMWHNRENNMYYCAECANVMNIKQPKFVTKKFVGPICAPAKIGQVYCPYPLGKQDVQEERDTWRRQVVKMVATSEMEWMVYYNTVFGNDLFETGRTFHLWMKKTGIAI
jgi:hypothetical protein